MASSQSFSMIQRLMLLSLAGVAGEQGATVVDLGDPAAHRRVVLHLAEHIGQEHHLTVVPPGDERVVCVVTVLDEEPGVGHA